MSDKQKSTIALIAAAPEMAETIANMTTGIETTIISTRTRMLN